MADRKQFASDLNISPALAELLEKARPATEEELREQRVSFAFGNAPQSDLITKESVRLASQKVRLK